MRWQGRIFRGRSQGEPSKASEKVGYMFYPRELFYIVAIVGLLKETPEKHFIFPI
jgi:hypothetical protein